MIVSLQVQKGKRVERYLRAVTDDDHVETVRQAVTAMLKTPHDFEIGDKRRTPFSKQRKKLPALRGDEEEKIPGTVEKIVEKAVTEPDSDR